MSELSTVFLYSLVAFRTIEFFSTCSIASSFNAAEDLTYPTLGFKVSLDAIK